VVVFYTAPYFVVVIVVVVGFVVVVFAVVFVAVVVVIVVVIAVVVVIIACFSEYYDAKTSVPNTIKLETLTPRGIKIIFFLIYLAFFFAIIYQGFEPMLQDRENFTLIASADPLPHGILLYK